MNFAVGRVWTDPNKSGALSEYGTGLFGDIEPLNVDDLICPTWGLGRTTSANGTIVTTIGPPFLPLIVPDMHAFTLDPTWSKLCSGVFTDLGRLPSFAIFDPPHPLTPVRYLLPTTSKSPTPAKTTADPTTLLQAQVIKSMDLAKPANNLASLGTVPTNAVTPDNAGKLRPVKVKSFVLLYTALPSNRIEADPAIKVDPRTISGTKTSAPLTATVTRDNAEPLSQVISPHGLVEVSTSDSEVLPTSVNRFLEVPSQTAVECPPPTGVPMTSADGSQITTTWANEPSQAGQKADDQGAKSNSQTQAVDPLRAAVENLRSRPLKSMLDTILGLASRPPPEEVSSHDFRNSHGLPEKVTSHTLTSNPSGTVLYSFGESTHDTTIAVATTPSTAAASNPPHDIVLVPLAQGQASGALFTVGTRTFSAGQNGFAYGVPSTTLGGSIASPDRSKIIIVGNSTFCLFATAFSRHANDIFTVASQGAGTSGSDLPEGAIVVTAGDEAVNVGGTLVSLQPSGALLVGSSKISLPPSVESETPQASPTMKVSPTVQASQTVQSSALVINGLSVQMQPSMAAVDGMTLKPGAGRVTISDKFVSLESGAKILDVGTQQFVLPEDTMRPAMSTQASQSGQSEIAVPLGFVVGICATLMLLT